MKIILEQLNQSSIKVYINPFTRELLTQLLQIVHLDIDKELYDTQFKEKVICPNVTNIKGNYYLLSSNENTLIFPIGFKEEIIKVIKNYKELNNDLNIELSIKTLEPKLKIKNSRETNSDIRLRPYQLEAIDTILKERFLTVKIPTGGGKTHIAMELLRLDKKSRFLYLVNTRLLLNQTYDRMKESIDKKEIGLVGDGHFDINRRGTIALANSFYYKLKEGRHIDKILNFLKSIKILIVDEPQDVLPRNDGYLISSLCVNKDYSIGLSATPNSNSKNIMVYAQTGRIKFNRSEEEFIEKNYICDPTFRIYEVPLVKLSNHANKLYNELTRCRDNLDSRKKHYIYQTLDREVITHNFNRNRMLCNITLDVINKRDSQAPVLVVVKTINGKESHASKLLDILKELDNTKEYRILSSSKSKAEKERILKDIKEGNIDCVFVTSKLFGTGIDIPYLSYLVLAHVSYKPNHLLQVLGRVLRYKEDKKTIIIDFKDNTIFYENQSSKRIETYKSTYNVSESTLIPIDYHKEILINKYS